MPTTKRRARKNAKEAKAKIGQQKTVSGITYELNKNYRWERTGKRNIEGFDYSSRGRLGKRMSMVGLGLAASYLALSKKTKLLKKAPYKVHKALVATSAGAFVSGLLVKMSARKRERAASERRLGVVNTLITAQMNRDLKPGSRISFDTKPSTMENLRKRGIATHLTASNYRRPRRRRIRA